MESKQEERKMRTVVVTAIGSFSADIVIKKCRENGMRVIGCDVYPGEWIADAGNAQVFHIRMA